MNKVPMLRALPGAIEPSTGASRAQDSEAPAVPEQQTRLREKVQWELKLNVIVTAASPEGKLMEMRDAFMKNLSEEGGCDKYPFGKTDKRIHGFYIKHNGDTSVAQVR